jgi:hypothetical protein
MNVTKKKTTVKRARPSPALPPFIRGRHDAESGFCDHADAMCEACSKPPQAKWGPRVDAAFARHVAAAAALRPELDPFDAYDAHVKAAIAKLYAEPAR